MKIIIYLLFGVVFLSCSHSIQEQVIIPSIMIDVDHAETLKLSDLYADVSYIPLSDSFLISTIEKAKIYENKLFLLTNKSILVYDINSGKILLELRHLGQGPGEYISLYDMLYDKNENTIELLDMNRQKVLKYGFDGHFISEFTTSFFSFAFYKIDRSTYLFYNSNMISDITNHKLIRYDARTSKVMATRFPIDKHLASYFFMVDVNNFGSVTHPTFHFCPSDTIYGFTDNYEPYAKYGLNFGKHHMPHQFYEKTYTDIFDFSVKAVQQSYIYAYDNFCENDYITALSFRNDKKLYWVLFDKNKQTTWTIDRWVDDYHSSTSTDIMYDNGPFIIDGKHLYFFLQPTQLIDLMKKEESSNIRENNHNILEDIYHSSDFSEQSNPILVKCKFKES
jgi:hypothetical protein